MPEESEEDESFDAGSDEGESDDESLDAEDGVTGVRRESPLHPNSGQHHVMRCCLDLPLHFLLPDVIANAVCSYHNARR